jgi:hypothetical protein
VSRSNRFDKRITTLVAGIDKLRKQLHVLGHDGKHRRLHLPNSMTDRGDLEGGARHVAARTRMGGRMQNEAEHARFLERKPMLAKAWGDGPLQTALDQRAAASLSAQPVSALQRQHVMRLLGDDRRANRVHGQWRQLGDVGAGRHQ